MKQKIRLPSNKKEIIHSLMAPIFRPYFFSHENLGWSRTALYAILILIHGRNASEIHEFFLYIKFSYVDSMTDINNGERNRDYSNEM